VVAFLLITYMAGQKRPDFYLSTLAGVALFGVIALPTWRPGVEESGLPQCGSEPKPSGCSNVQQLLGESTTAVIHSVCAAVCFVCLALICFFWARRDMGESRSAAEKKGEVLSRRELSKGARVRVPATCGVLILLAILWVPLGVDIGPLSALYLGEVVAILAFAAAWLFSSWDLWKLMFPAGRKQAAAEPAPALGT